jgi:hypothetical protein
MSGLNRVRNLSKTSSLMGASFSGRRFVLAVLMLIGCASLVFNSGVDHHHASPVAMDQDCVVCDAGNTKNRGATAALSAPEVFSIADDTSWTAYHLFLSRFGQTNPRAPPQQLAFV